MMLVEGDDPQGQALFPRAGAVWLTQGRPATRPHTLLTRPWARPPRPLEGIPVMRMIILVALALVVSASGCTTLKPSHREPAKSVKAASHQQPFESAEQIEQVQYVQPQGAPWVMRPVGYAACAQPACAQPACAQAAAANAPPSPLALVSPAGPPAGYGPMPGQPYPYAGGWGGHPGGPHRAGGYPPGYGAPQGPPVAQTAYPYYTIRGPRDFFINNPPSIGR
jgi:hypothetical protein